jgi:hypothetical protein
VDSDDGPHGERVARFFLEQVLTSRGHAVVAMIRPAVADPGCIPTLRSTIENTVVTAVASILRGRTARLRAELLGAQIVGLFIVRHIVRVEPLASEPTGVIARLWGPAVDVILGDLASQNSGASLIPSPLFAGSKRQLVRNVNLEEIRSREPAAGGDEDMVVARQVDDSANI